MLYGAYNKYILQFLVGFVIYEENGHIVANRDSFAEVMGPYSYGTVDREGEVLLKFCKNHSLRIMSTFFKKDKNRIVTYVSGGAERQLDLILIRPISYITPLNC